MIHRKGTECAPLSDARHGLQWRTILMFTLGLCFTAGTLQALAQQGSPHLLFYDRSSVGAGALLGIVTGHLVHVGWMHYLLNMVGFALILLLFRDAWTPGRLLGVFMACMLAVDAGLWWLSPQVFSYAGLSGVLHGLLGAGAVLCWRGVGGLASFVLLATIMKLAWEQYVGPTTGTREIIGAPIIVDGHLYGFIAGVGAAFLLCATTGRRVSKPLS